MDVFEIVIEEEVETTEEKASENNPHCFEGFLLGSYRFLIRCCYDAQRTKSLLLIDSSSDDYTYKSKC